MGKIPAASTPAAKKKPIANYEAKSQKIKSGARPSEKCWVFSFRFWRQIEFFGLDRTNATWFVSVLDKFQQLSNRSVGDFFADPSERDSWRYHQIKWTQKNIPIQRKSLSWLPSNYLENEEDFPLYQFQISQSLGRVVGFWDEKLIFNVILLDPLHNMQPTESTGYRVDPCSPLPCDYSLLINCVENIANECAQGGCPSAEKYRGIEDRKKELQAFSVLMLCLTDTEFFAKAQKWIDSGLVKSHVEIFEYGVAKMSEDFQF